jgi:hypothetical protein
VQQWLAAQRIADDLCSDTACDFLARRLARGVVKTAATLLRVDNRAIENLERSQAGPKRSHAMAARFYAGDRSGVEAGQWSG